ncbi:hypothetical protein D3C80_1043430 [compost metagenome]
MQDQHQGRIGLVRAVPVEIEKVAIGQPHPFTLMVQGNFLSTQGTPERLQVRVSQPPTGCEHGRRAGALSAGGLVDGHDSGNRVVLMEFWPATGCLSRRRGQLLTHATAAGRVSGAGKGTCSTLGPTVM